MKKVMYVVKTILKVLVLVALVSWVVIVVTDYLNTLQERPLKFCLKEDTREYEDGTVYECDGLGYKVFKYDRKTIVARQFGPFFIKEKKLEDFK